MPGEVEKVAAYLGISIEDLFRNDLCVDWYESNEDMFVLSPSPDHGSPGTEYPSEPHGMCDFLRGDGTCRIYPVRPYECRESIHDEEIEDIEKRHKEIAEAWIPHIKQIEGLLGRSPCATDWSPSICDMLFGE
jgi:Fe-S-cluster containining protein